MADLLRICTPFSDQLPGMMSPSLNLCEDCHLPMETQGDEYVCAECGRIVTHIDAHLSYDAQKMSGVDWRRGNSDPSRAQRANVYDCLIEKRETYLRALAQQHGLTYTHDSILVGNAGDLARLVPSTVVLEQVAQAYNDIQRHSAEQGTAFVHRSGVKDEILAAILFAMCEKSEPRSKKEIAEMMGLRTGGFSRGREHLLVQTQGHGISIDERAIHESKICHFYERTLGAFLDVYLADTAENCLTTARQSTHRINLEFIRRIIQCSIAENIGVQSQLQSRIVGTIWFIIAAMGYRITAQQLDTMSGNIKRSTFIKFSRVIIRSRKLRAIVREFFPHLANPRDAIYNLRL